MKEKISVKEKEQWNVFYDTVGGKYICSECGSILTWFQYDKAKSTSGKGYLISFIIAVVLCPIFFIGPVLGAIYLTGHAPKNGCPLCHVKPERIFPLNSQEGMAIFKTKHKKLAHLLKNLSVHGE